LVKTKYNICSYLIGKRFLIRQRAILPPVT
jgi:hypothetical protein